MSSRADANADRQKFLTKLLGVNESEIASIKERTFKLANAPQNLDTFANLLNDRRKQKIEALSAVLREEDDLGKIVRAHIHIEHELQELIFFAAPNPAHLKSKMDFSEKVQLALVLGMNPELKPALNATAKLRNKFAHELDMKIGQEEVSNLIATLTSSIKQRFKAILQIAIADSPATPVLEGEELSYFHAQIKATVFFIQLFDEVAKERHRLAFEKMQLMAWH